MTTNAYDPIARAYDVLWGAVSVTRYLPAIVGWLSESIVPGARVLDVACGTGQMAASLADHGYRVTGVDIAPAMVAIARRHSCAEFAVAQLGCLPFADHAFAATLCLFDSLNHVGHAQIAGAIADLARVTAPGGLLVFDINTDFGFRQRWHGTSAEVRDDLVCVARASYDTETRAGEYRITAMESNGEGAWTRADALVHEYMHSDAAIRHALAAVRLSNVEMLACDEDLGLVRDLGRVFYLVRKEACD